MRLPDKGFTLLELMIASAILLIAILSLLVVFINCMLLNESNNNLITAANDAQYVLEQVKALPYSGIANYAANYPPASFTNLNNETIAINCSLGANIGEVTVNVNWSSQGRQKNFQLSTRITRQ